MNKDIIVFALSSSIELADEICGYLNVKRGKCKVEHFSDGEIIVEPEESVRGKHVFIVQSTNAPTSATVMEVLIALDACKRASASEISVVMPYFGYARQDRKARARQPISSRLMADLYEVAGANRMVTIDLHAPQIQGFFKIPTDDLTVVSMFGQYYRNLITEGVINNQVVVVSPDHGGATRARKLADTIPNSTVAIIDKRRNKPNEAEAVNLIGDVRGKTAIVVDDIIDTGGSMVSGIDMLYAQGATDVYAACSHGVLSGLAIERISGSKIKELLVSNSIALSEEARSCDKIKEISVANMLAKTIQAINEKTPVSNIYNLFND